jgi:hypothetical protein
MKYFYLEPEVAGELGERTILDSSVHPPVVDKLHYKFDGWLGDVILESFPCLIATQDVANALAASGASGVNFAELEVTVSDTFRELYPTRKIPAFKWLKVYGIPGKDDFGIAVDHRLVVSEKGVNLLRSYGMSNALTEPFGKAVGPSLAKQHDLR